MPLSYSLSLSPAECSPASSAFSLWLLFIKLMSLKSVTTAECLQKKKKQKKTPLQIPEQPRELGAGHKKRHLQIKPVTPLQNT